MEFNDPRLISLHGSARPDSGHFSQDRLRADVHRAVGGSLNLIREISRISEELDADILAEWLVKRALFFSYELQGSIPENASDAEKLSALNRFFFDVKKFRCSPGSFVFHRVLMARTGAPLVISFLYSFLAERLGVELDFVDFKPACFLRWNEKDSMGVVVRSRFIDVTKNGALLSSDDVIELLHSRFQTEICHSTLFEEFAFETVLTHYVRELKSSMAEHAHEVPEQMLFLQNTLIAYQPSNIHLLAERAKIHRRLGHFKSALADLKRYFAFNEREKSPPELVKLHDDLVRLLNRHKVDPDKQV